MDERATLGATLGALSTRGCLFPRTCRARRRVSSRDPRCVARDRGAASALREPDVFEQLERKIYKAGDCLSPNVASLKKVVVVASGVVDVRGGAPGLKPENILIDTAGYVRVVDFGFAKRLAGEQPTFTIVGTPEYLSPECALGQGYRMDVDLWAFGVLVFEMLKGNGPFCPADPDDTMAIFKLISDCRIEFSRKEVSAFGVPATSLCKELLNRSRKKRLGNLKGGVKNIKDHAYFAGVDFHAILNRRIAAPWNPEVSDPFDTSCFDEYDEAMDIPTFAGDQHAFTEFSDGTIDDSHLVHNVQQQLLPTVH